MDTLSVLKCITSANTAHVILLLRNFGTISVNGRGETLKHHNSHQNLQILWLGYFLNNGNKQLIANVFISRRWLPFDYKESEKKTCYTVQISEHTHEALQWAHWVQPSPTTLLSPLHQSKIKSNKRGRICQFTNSLC